MLDREFLELNGRMEAHLSRISRDVFRLVDVSAHLADAILQVEDINKK